MGSLLYGSWSIEEAGDIGKEFKAVCHASGGYEYQLTEGKEYVVRIETRILPMSPICSFINDRNKRSEAHLERFTKVEEHE
jgi:hypothetical protein